MSSTLLGRLGRRGSGKVAKGGGAAPTAAAAAAAAAPDVEKRRGGSSQAYVPLVEEGGVGLGDAMVSSTTAATSTSDFDAVAMRSRQVTAQEAEEARKAELQAEVCLDLEAASIYAAVLVATFGGVRVQMGHGREAKVHPAFLLLLCVPVFITQASAILFLRTDLDTETKVYDPWDPRSVALLKLKLVMVIIIYLTTFKNLVAAITQLVFVANPLTWIEVKHPRRDDWVFCGCCWRFIKYLFSTPTLWPCPVLALAMNFVVSYLVCVDSVSIILNAESAKDCIFDSLAITFIVELSSAWWEFCAHTFVFSPIDDYTFTLWPEEETWTSEGWVAEPRRSQSILPSVVNFIVWLTSPRCLGCRQSFLRIGHGANRVIRIIALSILFLLYCRQLFVVLYAIDTKVLPAARDLCTEYHMMLEDTPVSKMWRAFQYVTFVNLDEELADREDMRSNCLAEDAPLRRMTLSAMRMLLSKYGHVFLIFVASVGGVLFLPTLAHASQAWCGVDIESSTEREQRELRGEVAELRKEVSKLEDKVVSKQLGAGDA